MLPPPAPVVVVQQDMGGSLNAYGKRVLEYKGRKVYVKIEGTCASACTLVTALPPDQVCVGPLAQLAFHQAFVPVDPVNVRPTDIENRSEEGVAYFMRLYPQRVKDWIARQGGLTADLIILNGAELRRMFKVCRDD